MFNLCFVHFFLIICGKESNVFEIIEKILYFDLITGSFLSIVSTKEKIKYIPNRIIVDIIINLVAIKNNQMITPNSDNR